MPEDALRSFSRRVEGGWLSGRSPGLAR